MIHESQEHTYIPDVHKLVKQMNEKYTHETTKVNTLVQPEPPPITNQQPYVWDLVITDMRARDNFGKEKYNTRLQPFNGRDALVDAYQEVLDFAVYLRQLIFERDNK
jgi:hypothetical protein